MTLFVSLFVLLGLIFITLPQALETQAASAPNIVSYQGRVLNANGVPVTDTSLDMVFSLYDAASGGSCVWSNSSATCASQTAQAITVTDGLFSENLGDTGDSYAAISDSIFGANAALFLEVRIEGETLSPRKQITAAPYALNADTLDGTDSTGFLAATGDNGTGDYNFTGGNFDIEQSLALGADASISATEVLTVSEDKGSSFSTESIIGATSNITAGGSLLTGLALALTHSGGASTISELIGGDFVLATTNAGATTTTGIGLNTNVTIVSGSGTTNYGIRAGASGATTNYAGYFHGGQVFIDDDTTPETASVISGGAGDLYITDQFEVSGKTTTTGVVGAIRPLELTTGIGLSVSRPTSGSLFSNTTTGLVSFSVNDSSASGHLLHLDQDGSGTSVFIDQDGDTGGTLSATDGGALHIANTGNAHSAFTVYTNETSTSAAPLISVHSDNTSFDETIFEITNDSTDSGSRGLFINQTGAGVGAALDIATSTTGFAAEIFNDGNAATADGLKIQACEDTNPTSGCDYLLFVDGNGTTVGAIEGDGAGGVTNASSGSDYAELFDGVHGDFAVGDMIGLASDGTVTVAADGAKVIGAYSVAPNTLGNWREDWQTAGIYVPVALLGQVPVNVSVEGGSIQPGDYLTLSSTTGVAMKATGPAFMLGQALESASTDGQIMVFVEPKWHALNTIQNDEGVVIADTLALGNLGTATSFNVFDSQNFELRGSAWDGSHAVERSMTLFNDVTTTDAYQLSIANNDGNEVAFVNQAGDLAIAGKLYPSDRGVLQTDKYIYYDGSAGPSGNFMRTNAAGWATGSYDFAEMFPSLDALVPGEVVIFATDNEHVARSSSKTYDQRIAGIVSTQPGFLAGENLAGHVPIALAGRVPTFVTDENGPIAVGDPLTTSSLAGYAMKATEPGQIVGYAMEPMNASTGSIVVFVRPSFYNGQQTNELPGVENEASGLAGSISNFTTTHRLDLAAGSIVNISALMGIGENWSINESGDIVTGGRITHLIESYQGEQVETYVPVATETTVQISGTAQLLNGMASVDFEQIDSDFMGIISNQHAYRVFLTASSPTNPLYAMNREQDGFRIREVDGTSNATIDWLVIAYHKDYAPDEVTGDSIFEEEFDPNKEVDSSEGGVTESTEESEEIGDEAEESDTVDPIEDDPVIDEVIEEPVEEETSVEEVPDVEEDQVVEGSSIEEPVTEEETQEVPVVEVVEAPINEEPITEVISEEVAEESPEVDVVITEEEV